MTTLEIVTDGIVETAETVQPLVLPDIGELLATGQLELNEGQAKMLAYMVSQEMETRFARRDVIDFGEGTRGDRERGFMYLVAKIHETPGLGELFQYSGSKSQRVYWFGSPLNEEASQPIEESNSAEAHESHNRLESAGDVGWMALALCKNLPPNTFFPSDGHGVETARKICRECPVIQNCLQHALVNRIDHGVWGGASERERRRILKRTRTSQ